MARSLNRIVLKAKGHYDEGRAGATIYPGEAIRMQSDETYDPETLTPDAAAGRGLSIAKEAVLDAGGTVDDAYASGDIVFFYIPLPGDHVNVLVKAGEDIDIGDYLDVEGSGSGKFIEVASTAVANNTLPLISAKVHDAMATNLPAAAANDDLGLITGTPGTDAPTIQAGDMGGATIDRKCAFELVLPQTYRAGSALTIRAKAGMLTTLADTSATLDCEVWKDAGDGSVGSDLCTTAAQDINSLTAANKDFTITPTGLVPGDRLIVRLSVDAVDAGDLGVMIPEISGVSSLIGSAAVGRLEAIEDSSGVLASATLIKCRVMSA